MHTETAIAETIKSDPLAYGHQLTGAPDLARQRAIRILDQRAAELAALPSIQRPPEGTHSPDTCELCALLGTWCGSTHAAPTCHTCRGKGTINTTRHARARYGAFMPAGSVGPNGYELTGPCPDCTPAP